MVSDSVYYGLKKVDAIAKRSLVRRVFDSVAPKYDLMNDIMSFGLHRLWKRELFQEITLKPEDHIIDVAGGTGDISLGILKKAQNEDKKIQVTNCDLTFAMLKEGRNRFIDQGINEIALASGDAQSLPFSDRSFSHYVISFGLRNVPLRQDALKEAFRVLKPGGAFYCLEFSHIYKPKFRALYEAYAFRLIPKIGEKITKDRDSYQYLVDSIETFPDQETLTNEIRDAGFKSVSYRNLSFGLVAIHKAQKE